MGLYETIVGVYDEIFPLDPAAKAFLGSPSGHIDEAVDMGCATGSYTRALAELGWRARGVDPSPAMIHAAMAIVSRAGAPAADAKASFILGGMLDLDAMFQRGSLGLVLCVGNTLAHLAAPGEAAAFIEKAKRVLAPGGRLVIQILNYERILRVRPSHLPDIRLGETTFERSYGYRDDGLVDFLTELHSGAGVERDVTVLRPYTRGEIEAMLSSRGFSSVAYADWAKAAFDPQSSFSLILSSSLPG